MVLTPESSWLDTLKRSESGTAKDCGHRSQKLLRQHIGPFSAILHAFWWSEREARGAAGRDRLS